MAPSTKRSPKMHTVIVRMDETGVSFFLDVQDKELPRVFCLNAETTPVWGERVKHLYGYFMTLYQRANLDAQKNNTSNINFDGKRTNPYVH